MTTTTRNRRALPRHPHADSRWYVTRTWAGSQTMRPAHVLWFCGDYVSTHDTAQAAAHARWHAVETHRAAVTGRPEASCPTCTSRA